MMEWKKHIVADPDVLAGKPVVKGTRLSVDFILSVLAEGWTEEQVLENYPQLTQRDLQAAFAFVRVCMADEEYITLRNLA
jgi:uncharacterized protein (DUF433 family)